MLTEAVLEKKLAWIREAKTIGALKEIAAPCVPRMAGNGTFQEGALSCAGGRDDSLVEDFPGGAVE